MEPQWYCYFDRTQDGPLSQGALARRFGERVVPLHALVWCVQQWPDARWRPAREVPAFLSAATAPPLPVPKAVPVTMNAPASRQPVMTSPPRGVAAYANTRLRPPAPKWPPRRSAATPPLWTAQPVHRPMRGLVSLVVAGVWLLTTLGHYVSSPYDHDRTRDRFSNYRPSAPRSDDAAKIPSPQSSNTAPTPRPWPGGDASSPTPLQAHLREARDGMLGAHWRVAIQAYTAVLTLHPGSLEALAERGSAYDALGFHDRAMNDWASAADLRATTERDCFCRGTARLALAGRTAQGFDDMNAAAGMYARDASDFCLRALAHYHLREFDDAIYDFQAAVRLDPRAARALAGLGDTERASRQYSRAVADYNEALAVNPDYRAAYLNRALAYRALGRSAEAERDEASARRLVSR